MEGYFKEMKFGLFIVLSFLFLPVKSQVYAYLEGAGNNGVVGINAEYFFPVSEDEKWQISPSAGYGGFLFFDDIDVLFNFIDGRRYAIFPLQANVNYTNFGDEKTMLTFGGGPTIVNSRNLETNELSSETSWTVELLAQRDLTNYKGFYYGAGATYYLDDNVFLAENNNQILPLFRLGKLF